ncbi:MAG: DMT family protein [Bacteroidota bacterium]|nr:DMT family protein [Bacteroidota bacterium]
MEVSWCIALLEYIVMVPVNRMGFAKGMSGFQLKMIQDVITLVVFAFFAVT